MLMLFSISMLGYLLIHRIFSAIAHDFAISPHIVRIVLRAKLVLIGLIIVLSASPTLLWLFIGILLITLKFFPTILRFFLLKRLRRQLIPLLDSTILGLQAGKSFRSSLILAIDNQSGWTRHQLQELIESIQFSDREISVKSALLKDFREEIIEIDRSQSRCIDQVRSLRKRLKMQEDFRRRSGQVTQQIKMQAIIVTALYLALFVFVITQFGFQNHKKLIFMSILIFIGGLLGIFLIGKRMKWKV